MLVKSNVVVFRHVIVREVTGGGRDRKEIPSFPSHNRPRQRAGDDDPVVAGEHPGEALAVTLRQRLPQPPLLLPASPADSRLQAAQYLVLFEPTVSRRVEFYVYKRGKATPLAEPPS